MATLVITLIIAVAVFYGLRSFIKGKGACGDCNCSCPVKNEMHKAKK
ncbi:MAG: FeoB-associated Cys-rich membrane protein [Streptococcus orisratti]|nr:FeoB-associated Cys-rich membrane protein [Streptococcus orisratti]MCI7677938.1 FeoB-associated Cys-rich membrane protein [Streptococcus orisratti]MDY4002405.1 FeoB-associated Cys-rich membrane protein [Streptococcus orisratti]MDY5636585.1 FeoB-associated Cys-rich membrane protein [Streptococcus orisratti]